MSDFLAYCRCGHTGGAPKSQHGPGVAMSPGQGECRVPGCECKQFTWVRLVKKEPDRKAESEGEEG